MTTCAVGGEGGAAGIIGLEAEGGGAQPGRALAPSMVALAPRAVVVVVLGALVVVAVLAALLVVPLLALVVVVPGYWWWWWWWFSVLRSRRAS